jgi:hypothetical protein
MDANTTNHASTETVARLIDNVVRPVSRTLMRFGTSVYEFNEVSRWAFVKKFWESREFWRRDRPTACKAR